MWIQENGEDLWLGEQCKMMVLGTVLLSETSAVVGGTFISMVSGLVWFSLDLPLAPRGPGLIKGFAAGGLVSEARPPIPGGANSHPIIYFSRATSRLLGDNKE